MKSHEVTLIRWQLPFDLLKTDLDQVTPGRLCVKICGNPVPGLIQG